MSKSLRLRMQDMGCAGNVQIRKSGPRARTPASGSPKRDRDEDGVDATAQFQDRLNSVAKDTEALLDRLLAPGPGPEEVGRPGRLLEAMRYASLGAGKRFRPFLVVETASLFGVDRQRALMAGAALECIHCYS